jgi:hypothetical protein
VNETDGWLADQSTWKSGLTKVFPYDAYPGNKSQAGWLLDNNAAALYRAFSTYDSLPLSFDLPFEYPYKTLFAPRPLNLPLEIDATKVTSWTKIDVLNYGETVLTLASEQFQGSILTFQIPITQRGTYALSALVTHSDGQTQSTTNLLAVVEAGSVPEPATGLIATIGFAAAIATCRQPRRHCLIWSRRKHIEKDLRVVL